MSLFKIKTNEAFTIKVLAELLQFNFKECCLVCNQSGIYISNIDSKFKNASNALKSSKSICVNLYRDRFKTYKSPDNLLIGLNLSHFFKVLKSIKRKDSLTLSIEANDPTKLIITIEPLGDSNSIVKHINITNIQPINISLPEPELYDDPIVATCKEFQKLKTLNKMSKYITVTREDRLISFFSDKEGVYSCNVPFGEKSEDANDDEMEIYKQQFETEDIIQLIKVAGLAPSIQLYFTQGLPLKFKLNVGSLGDITIHNKSREMIEDEQEDQV